MTSSEKKRQRAWNNNSSNAKSISNEQQVTQKLSPRWDFARGSVCTPVSLKKFSEGGGGAPPLFFCRAAACSCLR